MGESYDGRVVIRQESRAVPAHATIVVNEEGSGWEIAFEEEPGATADFDRTRLMEVALPGGGSGRFVHWRRSASKSLGIGLGWPPTVARTAR